MKRNYYHKNADSLKSFILTQLMWSQLTSIFTHCPITEPRYNTAEMRHSFSSIKNIIIHSQRERKKIENKELTLCTLE